MNADKVKSKKSVGQRDHREMQDTRIGRLARFFSVGSVPNGTILVTTQVGNLFPRRRGVLRPRLLRS